MLVDGLKDPDKHVRQSAARMLGGLGEGGIGAVPALENKLNDPEKIVREAVVEALAAIDLHRFQHLKAERKIE